MWLTRIAEWFGRQWRDTQRYFNLSDRSQTRPPALLFLAGGLVLLVIILIIWF